MTIHRQLRWPKALLKLFGVLNLFFACAGFYQLGFVTFSLVSLGRYPRFGDPSAPYVTEAFFLMTSINFIFLAVLFFAGFLLLRLRAHAVRVNNTLFVSMIIYELTLLLINGGALGTSIVTAFPTANVGIAPTIFTGYPILALIVLNLAHRRLRDTSKD